MGFLLLEELKKDPATKDIPVMIISAKTLTSDDRSQLEGRVESLWQKGSFNTRELVSHVVKTLGGDKDNSDTDPNAPNPNDAGKCYR